MLELLVVMAVMMILMTFMLPAFQSTIRRGKLQGAAQEAAILMRKARFEAVKRNQQVAVSSAFAPRQITLCTNPVGGVCTPPQSLVLAQVDLPTGIEVVPGASTAPFPPDVPGGFTASTVVYQSNGSVAQEGSMEFTDRNNNRLRVVVNPRATARIEMQKWETDDFYPADEKVWKF